MPRKKQLKNNQKRKESKKMKRILDYQKKSLNFILKEIGIQPIDMLEPDEDLMYQSERDCEEEDKDENEVGSRIIGWSKEQ